MRTITVYIVERSGKHFLVEKPQVTDITRGTLPFALHEDMNIPDFLNSMSQLINKINLLKPRAVFLGYEINSLMVTEYNLTIPIEELDTTIGLYSFLKEHCFANLREVICAGKKKIYQLLECKKVARELEDILRSHNLSWSTAIPVY